LSASQGTHGIIIVFTKDHEHRGYLFVISSEVVCHFPSRALWRGFAMESGRDALFESR
jgi:hypothetical protein